MSFPRYERYKDSGVEWLGEVPEHWQVRRLRYSARLLTAKATEQTNPLALENIESWTGRLLPSDTKFEGDGTSFRAGDLLFGKLRPYLAKAYLAQSEGEAVGDFHVMRPSPSVSGRFLFHQIVNRDSIDLIDGSTFGSKMPRVGWDFMSNIVLATPPIAEQTRIVDFITQETAKIDGLIEEQRRLIELLKEKRQAVISHAVTKGLDPNVPFRDSGVASFGFIPSHWSIRKIQALARVGNGSTPSRERFDYWDGGEYPWLSSTVVNQEEVTQADQFVTELALKECHLPKISPPAVLIGITGQGKTRGMATTLRFEATINQHIAAVVPRNAEINIEFLRRVFDMLYIDLRSDSEGGGSTKGAITCEQIQSLRIAVPPVGEQIKIASWIRTKSEEFAALMDQAESAISLLQERRSALITAAVTGKIDVRNYTPKEAA